VPILATKLYVPAPRPGIVGRGRLDQRLDTALHRKLTLVSAAAGFGKTTAIVDWARRRGHRIAWLSLDDTDSDLRHFLAYLVSALHGPVPGAGDAVLPMLEMPHPPPAETALTRLVNDLAAVSCDLVLVLDDYHTVDSPPVDEAVAFLVDHLPPQVHLILAGREDPSLPLARLRASGDLTELRAMELRFTAEESARFLNDVRGLGLSGQDIAALEASTEGWIAGLQLAAISLEGQPDPAALIRGFSGSHRFVLDYLVAEVLDRQPPEVVRFLLETSILDRLSGPLCDAVTLGASGQRTLERLDRSNLFVVPLDGERRWYRYHHLFGDCCANAWARRSPRRPGMRSTSVRAGGWRRTGWTWRRSTTPPPATTSGAPCA